MGFRSWKFFFICLVITISIINWAVLAQSLNGFVNKENMLFPLYLVLGITFIFRAIFPQKPPIWLKIILTIGASYLNIRYLHWRAAETLVLNWYDGPISLAIFIMEFIAILNVTILSYQTLIPTNRSPEADIGEQRIKNGYYTPTVDVFIPTYNEPIFVLRRTIVGCQAMRYPHKQVWLLDDGKRPEAAQLATDLGCNYLTRPDGSHAKAGNLNNGLLSAKGEIVVVFDADFIPLQNFLERTIGFFENPKVAMVVTPQNFYNPDQPEINLGGCLIPHEQTVFYNLIQPGRDFTNSVVCTGTSSMMRRKHLDEIGGIPIGTIVEDWTTGMMLQARGYKTIFLNELLSVGAAPENFSSYLVQRIRWAEGTIKLLYTKYNPMFLPGLNIIQRINHLSGILFWIDQATQSVSYIAPILFFLFGMRSMNTSLPDLVYYWLPNYVAGLFMVSWVIGSRTIIVTYAYNALQCFYLVPTLVSTLLFPKRKVKFKVTPKGLTQKETSIDAKLMRPIIILLVLNLVAAAYGIFKAQATDYFYGAHVVNLVWVQFISLVLAISLLAGVDIIEERNGIRVKCSEICKIQLLNQSKAYCFSRIIDISESGVAFHAPETMILEVGQTLEFYIPEEEIRLNARVVRTGYVIGCAFLGITPKNHRLLIEYIFCRPHRWKKPKVANELQALRALFRSIFELYPLQGLR